MTEQPNDLITIVSGLPRSGTSMMMRMLEAGGIPTLVDNIRRPDADNPNGYYEFEPVKKTKENASWLDHAAGKVVKMVYLLLYDLPLDRSYRVVFMRRHLDEVIGSQNVMLERRSKPQSDLTNEQLRATFETQLKKIEEFLDKRANSRTFFVDYNEMLRDPAPLARALNEFLGGTLNIKAMTNVVDPSLYHQRSKT